MLLSPAACKVSILASILAIHLAKACCCFACAAELAVGFPRAAMVVLCSAMNSVASLRAVGVGRIVLLFICDVLALCIGQGLS